MMGSRRVSRFSRTKFLCMHGVLDSAGPLRTRVVARSHVAFWLGDTMGFLKRVISELNIPACRYPCPTLQAQPYDCSHMARGQGGSLFLPCTTLSFATSCRFIPALSAHAAGADRRQDLIGSQTSPNRQRHSGWNDFIPAIITAGRIRNDKRRFLNVVFAPPTSGR